VTSDKPQQSKAIKRRKEIWEALHPRTSQKFESVWDALGVVEGPMTEAEKRKEIQVGEVFPPVIGYGKPPPQSKSFAAEAAAITSESKRNINQQIARADALGDGLTRSAQRRSIEK
jgi:hypothetical protein